MVEVSINILNYNTYEKTKKCIDSCLEQNGIEYEIILIDNDSSDDSLERLRKEYGDKITYLVNDENYGYAKGNNLGIKFCANKNIKYTLILNSDITLVGKNLLLNMVRIMKNHQNCGIVAPAIYNVTSKGYILNENDSLYLELLRKFKILPKNEMITDELCTASEAQGSALLVNTNLFNDLGGFPEHYFMYGEEGCFAKKILWNHKKIFWYKNKDNYVLHHHDKSGRIAKWQLYLMGRNRSFEYLENRNDFDIRWRIVYSIFYLRLKLKNRNSNMNAYICGVQEAKKMYKSKEDTLCIYNDGKNARNKYGD